MTGLRIRKEFESLEALQFEFEQNLTNGGLFASGQTGFEENSLGVLELVHPVNDEILELQCKIVWAVAEGDNAGTGVALTGFDNDVRGRIRTFIDTARQKMESGEKGEGEPGEDNQGTQATLQQRLRGLNTVEQQKLARTGNLSERKTLERMYGKNVWDSLLRNPQITAPEVAGMAQKGTMPRVNLESIVNNAAWVKNAMVRRALLGNPKLGRDHLTKILRAMPGRELKMVASQTAYPMAVREAAKKIVTV